MIIPVHKYLIYGAKNEMDQFFDLAQRAGFLEFIGKSQKRIVELPDEGKTLIQAIKIAKKHEIHPLETLPIPSDPFLLAKKIVELHSSYETLLEEQRLLQTEITRIRPFGNFSKEELIKIQKETKRTFQFFCMKSGLSQEITLPSEVIFVGTDYDLDYFVSLNKESMQYPKMIEITIDRPLGELNARWLEVSERIAGLDSDIRYYSNALSILQEGLTSFLNEHHLQLAKNDIQSLINDSVFAIETWIPETKIKSLFGLIRSLKVYAEEIAVETIDRVPTCMENIGAGKIGEDLVHIYDTPANQDKDPSIWVLAFFSLFFAMIVSDAGYGLIYLTLGLVLKYKFKKATGLFKRFIKLILILSTSCIIWGVATLSFFGMQFAPSHPFQKISIMHFLAEKKADYLIEKKNSDYESYLKEFPKLVDVKTGEEFLEKATRTQNGKIVYTVQENFSDQIFMELSLFIGIIHLSISCLRNIRQNLAGIGWVIAMVGGFLYFPKIIDATSFLNYTDLISKETAYLWGVQMLISGGALALLLAIYQKKWGGLHEIMNVMQVFADVLSYLRLYALALAGMIIAKTFNQMGMEAGFFSGLLIILVGHLTNLFLAIMGGTIHGLRLNFLEWYHYSFEGGGRLFNPLRIKK